MYRNWATCLLKSENGMEVSVAIYTVTYDQSKLFICERGAEWSGSQSTNARVILYIQPTRMRRIEAKMQCLIDMVCKCKRASKRVRESVCDGGTGESLVSYYVVGT